MRSGPSRAEISDELNARACEALGVESAAVPGGFPSRSPTTCAPRGRARGRPRALRAPAAGQERARARRDPPAQKAAEAGMDAARELLPPRAAADRRGGEGRDRGALQRARLHRGRVHRLARPAVGDRPPRRRGRDRRGRADRDRPLAPRPRVRLLRRHDAHVRDRRAERGAARVAPPLQGGARPRARRDPRRRHRPLRLRRHLRDLRGRRATRRSARRRRASRSRRASSTRSATASGSRCTRSRRSGMLGGELVAGDVVSVEPGSTGRASAAAGSRTSCS